MKSMDAKKDFTIFENQKGLVYLDSAASSLTPRVVVDKMREYYDTYRASESRGLYSIAERATAEYAATRKSVAEFLHAKSADEIVFTRNATEAINVVAAGLADNISQGGNVVVTRMEHHANFIPWQQLAKKTGTDFRVIDFYENGELVLAGDDASQESGVLVGSAAAVVDKNTQVLAITAASNVFGTTPPLKEIIAMAREANPGIVIIVDAAQAAPHRKIDVQELDCDFLAFSAHKMLGPTGVGVLWGKASRLETLPPLIVGGGMIEDVTLAATTFTDPPQRFEAGTPNIAGVIAFKEAIKYLQKVGLDTAYKHSQTLAGMAREQLTKIFGDEIQILGAADQKSAIVSFTLRGIHAHDVAAILAERNIAIRAGHHCAQPLHDKLGLTGSARASFSLYNTEKDVTALVDGLAHVKKTLGKKS